MQEPPGFREFVSSRSRSLQRTAWLLTGDWASAEDLVQAALAKVWPKWSAISAADSPEAYVHRVLFTTFLAWRRRRWTGEHPVAVLPEVAITSDAYADSDLRAALLGCLATLPPRQRAVLVLRYYDDLTEAAAAEVLGCSIGTVKNSSAKALRSLRQAPGLIDVLSEARS